MRLGLLALFLLGLGGGRQVVLAGSEPVKRSRAAQRWVERTLASLSVEKKAAQMVMVQIRGRYQHPLSTEYLEIERQIHNLGVGGVVVSTSELETIPRLLNDLQEIAPVPLLVASDLERGVAFRVRRGTVSLPSAMALGATREPKYARFVGEVTAREGRALGIHWAFAPVADVNNNAANPVINIRSFGEEPQLVSEMVEAFIAGERAGGMMTTVKHFPGHGDTAQDSHLTRPAVNADRERLANLELVPFQRAITAGVDAVMPAHVSVPALDASGAPATLSPAISTALLREELGFEGLVVTDALEMAGVRPAWSGEAAVRAVQAGADVVLMPSDPYVAVQSLVRAVAEGRFTEERLDRSVRRLLRAKTALGLHRNKQVDRNALKRDVARPDDENAARILAAESITAVRNQGGVLPLAAERPLRVLHLVLARGYGDPAIRGIAQQELRARRVEATSYTFGRELSEATIREIASSVADYTHILVSSFAGVSSSGEELSPAQVRLLEAVRGRGPPMIVVAHRSPYLLRQIPDADAYLCTYGAAEVSQRAAIAALFGETAVRGKLPITLPGLYKYGHGLGIPRREMTLRRAVPEEAGFRREGLAVVDEVVEEFLAQGAFPGGVLAVGRQGKLVHLKPFGHLTFDEGSPSVTADTLYDLASLTKVVATTIAAMILVDEGALDLDKPVRDFLPGFGGEGKDAVTVYHLLTHSPGLPAGGPLYRELRGKRAYLKHIQALPLDYEPGSRSVYSDFGMILLGEIIERVAGRPLDEYVRQRVYEPLAMADTLFNPPAELRERIAPTETDAWRGYTVHGEVHDENTFAMGGVAGHAGLFSTAGDLARFAQMILNGGVFEHRRIVSRATVERFVRRAGILDSDRAIGWDTKSAVGSSAGRFFSPDSFGHLGFTGTSIWIDPQRELFVILLTNRVHPSRENKLIRKVRPAVADAVVRALAEPLVRVGLERLAAERGRPLRGQRVGLIAHAASVTANGEHAIDVLRKGGVELVRVFAPEHGLRGRAAAGERVSGGVDPVSGLPEVSLYGEKRKPAPEDLDGLDAVVFDLQGAGVRFYTYVSTLILTLEAAAEAGVEFVVLDRPNPLGGERVEGPVSAPRERVPASFVNRAPGPLVHGLTLGEMARYVNARLEKPARLTVVPMRGWQRWMTWADTGRPWISPSPNLRSADAALAYPGTALLEATNVSEGRGTETPFLLLGAPWLPDAAPSISAPGFALRPVRFTPRGSNAAPHPKYRDEECSGVQVEVTDSAAVEPYRLGLELVTAWMRRPGFAWRRDGAALTWLLGTDRVLAQLTAGAGVDEIVAADREDHEAWRRDRRDALLY